jgi:hypothetical protein
MRPVAKLSSMRLCGAMIFATSVPNVMVNGLPICTIGAIDSHGGVAVTGSWTVFANGLPVCGWGDINDYCKWIWPTHVMQPLMICDDNVFLM